MAMQCNVDAIYYDAISVQYVFIYLPTYVFECILNAKSVLSYFQSVVGVMIQACMVGIIFSKLSRPKKRSQTLMFSKNSVVCQRDGVNCLLFRWVIMHNCQMKTLE